MTARDVSDTLSLALESSGLESAKVHHRPRLLSDNGPSYVSAELRDWLDNQGMGHTRGAPYHPMTQGKNWSRTLKYAHSTWQSGRKPIMNSRSILWCCWIQGFQKRLYSGFCDNDWNIRDYTCFRGEFVYNNRRALGNLRELPPREFCDFPGY